LLEDLRDDLLIDRCAGAALPAARATLGMRMRAPFDAPPDGLDRA
jgi:hypothetical protein